MAHDPSIHGCPRTECRTTTLSFADSAKRMTRRRPRARRMFCTVGAMTTLWTRAKSDERMAGVSARARWENSDGPDKPLSVAPPEQRGPMLGVRRPHSQPHRIGVAECEA
jgi:hypothetical protein